MNQNTCHYCLEEKDDFSIRGQYKVTNGDFLCYRLCKSCSNKFIGINSYSDKEGRHTFLNIVKANAQKHPLYVGN
ncbi:Uncharacterised protein [Legionella donaldsonii]|uniref:Uncharacterized protein n=1 Tax=Legionella donaldsonii TaxID=45060 RepID=A0A378JAR5_9GAMM|nr:Uncharacterised protein [Legionella donaldsonii]